MFQMQVQFLLRHGQTLYQTTTPYIRAVASKPQRTRYPMVHTVGPWPIVLGQSEENRSEKKEYFANCDRLNEILLLFSLYIRFLMTSGCLCEQALV